MPYTYSIAREAVDGMPMIRAMMLVAPNPYTLGTATRYQYMYGPWFLTAPVYRDTAADEEGNDIRDGIYLPDGEWIDYFTGDKYAGDRIINSFDAPLWKLPLFVRNGAIIPMTDPNNNVAQIDKTRRIYELYPSGYSSFIEYDDDGETEAYRRGEFASTLIESTTIGKETDNGGGRAVITVHPAEGSFDGFVTDRTTEFRINATAEPKRVTATVNGRRVKFSRAASRKEFEQGSDVWFYDVAPDMNRFATPDSDFAKKVIAKNPVIYVKLAEADITACEQTVIVDGFVFDPENRLRTTHGEP